MLSAVAIFLAFAGLGYRDYRRLPHVTDTLPRSLLRWRARGWSLSAFGVLTTYCAVVLSVGGADRGWWPREPLDAFFAAAAGALPASLGLGIVFCTLMGAAAHRRYPGPISIADRGVFRPSGRDDAGA